jgi:hypothetical protein
MMQRATNRVAGDDAVGERCVIVRAVRADGEEVGPSANEYYRLSVDFTTEQAAIRNLIDPNS